jgi:futalosine hydrolase
VSGATAAELLVITASELELERLLLILPLADLQPIHNAWGPLYAGRFGPLQLRLQALGIGKARTAAGLAIAIAEQRPDAVLQVGIGGAYLGSFLSIGLAMWAEEDLELDLGVASDVGWAEEALALPLVANGPGATRMAPCHPLWTSNVMALSGVPGGRFATLDAVTHNIDRGSAMHARYGVSIESMEGAAAALVAARLDVPLAQLRVVSNLVGDREKERWDIRGALRVAGEVLLRTLHGLAATPTMIPGHSVDTAADGPSDPGIRL